MVCCQGVPIDYTDRVQSLHGGVMGPLGPGDGLGVPVGHQVHIQVAGDADQEEEEVNGKDGKEKGMGMIDFIVFTVFGYCDD